MRQLVPVESTNVATQMMDARLRPRLPVALQSLTLTLSSGELEIDGQRSRIPAGVGRFLTGAQLKAMFAKYAGLLLFFKSGEAWQRVADQDLVELREDTALKTERPMVRTSPRFSRD